MAQHAIIMLLAGIGIPLLAALNAALGVRIGSPAAAATILLVKLPFHIIHDSGNATRDVHCRDISSCAWYRAVCGWTTMKNGHRTRGTKQSQNRIQT